MTLVTTKNFDEYEGHLGINADRDQVARLGRVYGHHITLTDYQAISSETAIYPGKGTLTGLLYVALGLGEAGEVQGKIKKVLRDDYDYDISVVGLVRTDAVLTDDRKEQLKGELGDLLWYVAQTAKEAGLDLGEIALSNIEMLNSRKERGVLSGSGDNR